MPPLIRRRLTPSCSELQGPGVGSFATWMIFRQPARRRLGFLRNLYVKTHPHQDRPLRSVQGRAGHRPNVAGRFISCHHQALVENLGHGQPGGKGVGECRAGRVITVARLPAYGGLILSGRPVSTELLPSMAILKSQDVRAPPKRRAPR